MSQSLESPKPELLGGGFSIGICAADNASNLVELLTLIEDEIYPVGMVLERVIIVASGCAPEALLPAREFANEHCEVILLEEGIRRGKANAINRIIRSFRGQYLVLVNSDARPEPGAISKLLTAISRESCVGMVSASPAVGGGGGVMGAVLRLMWSVHNECLQTLNEEDRNNHCCDELIAVRSEALRELPENTINDGAFLAGEAYRAGYDIRFCSSATVNIDCPNRYSDLLRQRRRIVYGHFQILRSMGESPRTVESMLFDNPRESLSILIRTVVKSPRLALVLPIAVVGEIFSVALAVADNLTSTRKYVPWDRFGSRA